MNEFMKTFQRHAQLDMRDLSSRLEDQNSVLMTATFSLQTGFAMISMEKY